MAAHLPPDYVRTPTAPLRHSRRHVRPPEDSAELVYRQLAQLKDISDIHWRHARRLAARSSAGGAAMGRPT